jgi:5-methylcytosine-specific restriction endonuclease McrA
VTRRFGWCDQLAIGICGLPGELWESERTDYRKPISDDLRAAIYERDGFRCIECLTDEDLTLDHIHPWSKGGADTYDNLRTLCRSCNSRKGARV